MLLGSGVVGAMREGVAVDHQQWFVSWLATFSTELRRRLRLTHHILRPLVLAQTQVGRMAHLACRGPFREFDLSYKLGLNPSGDSLIFDAAPEKGKKLCAAATACHAAA
jgi:hypothetical protein